MSVSVIKPGVRVLLSDGLCSGIVVGAVKSTPNGLLESIVDPNLAGTVGVDGLWHVQLEGYMTKSKFPKPVVVQVHESQVFPVNFVEPSTSLSHTSLHSNCAICTMQLKTSKNQNLTKSFDGADILNSCIAEYDQESIPVSAVENVLLSSEEVLHPIFAVRICRRCRDSLTSNLSFPSETCACCGTEATKCKSLTSCSGCSLRICSFCMNKKECRLFFPKYNTCAKCLYKSRLREQYKEIMDETGRREKKSITVFEPRRKLLLELELGEKIFADHANTTTKVSELLDKFGKDGFNQEAFCNDAYFSNEALLLLKSDLIVPTDSDQISASLYVERYFQELCDNLEQIRNDEGKRIEFYSEHFEKVKEFRITHENKLARVEDAQTLNQVLEKIASQKKFSVLPQNLSFSASKSHLVNVIIEGKSGEYIVVSRARLDKNEIFCELFGNLLLEQLDREKGKRFRASKQVTLSTSPLLVLDVNTCGNISHYLQFTNKREEANLELLIYLQVISGGGYSLKMFAKTTQPIDQHTPMVLYAKV